MFNIFKSNNEYADILVKQCPSCHGFVKSKESKCRHCGNSTQKEPVTNPRYKETKDRSDSKTDKFSI